MPNAAQIAQQSRGLPPGAGAWSPFPFAGMNLQGSPTAIADSEFLWIENFLRLGDGKFRTAYDVGPPLYTAAPLSIASFGFFTIGSKYYAIVFHTNGSAVQVDMGGHVTPIGPAGTFYSSGSGQLPAIAQFGTLFLLISNRNTPNDYWAWDGVLLYTAGTAAPLGVNIVSGGLKYTTTPTATVFGGTGSGIVLQPFINAGGVVNVNILNPGTGYQVGDVVQVQFSGGGSDTGAILKANLATGQVSAVNVTAPGSGYTDATAVFSGGGGTGAAGTVIFSNGVTSVAVTNGGSGYTSSPLVTFTGGGGTGATGTATLVGGIVTAVTVTNPGTGYTSAPTVGFSGGGGTLAAATASVAGGIVTGITITSGGTGYTSAPTIMITSGSGAGATAVALLAPASVKNVTVVNPGSGYLYAPNVTFVGGGGAGAAGVVELTGTSIAQVSVVAGGQNYQMPPTISFVGGGGGSGATAVAVLGGGQVIAINLTNGGFGYTTNVEVIITPAITGSGNNEKVDTGTGAGAIALFTPTSIAGVIMSNYGINYTSAPAIEIAPGANSAATATITMMPFGVSGSDMEIYLSRVWILNPANSPFATIPPGGNWQVSAPGSMTDFATSDGGVQFTNSDSFLQTQYVSVKQANGYLYFEGDGSVSVVSSVSTSGSPTTTSFNYQNVDPDVGNAFRDSLQGFGRTLIFANPTGIYGLYGGAATKISDKLNDLFTGAVFPSNGGLLPSSALATLFSVRHYLMLMSVIDPDTLAQRNVMVTWNEKDWTITSQGVNLTYIATQKVASVDVPWGTDGNALYPMFATPSATLTKRIDTKIYGGGGSAIMIKDLRDLYLQAQDQSEAQTGVDFTATLAVSGVPQVVTPGTPDAFDANPNTLVANPTVAPIDFGAPQPFWPVFGAATGGVSGVCFGARLTSTSPDFTLSNLILLYTGTRAFA